MEIFSLLPHLAMCPRSYERSRAALWCQVQVGLVWKSILTVVSSKLIIYGQAQRHSERRCPAAKGEKSRALSLNLLRYFPETSGAADSTKLPPLHGILRRTNYHSCSDPRAVRVMFSVSATSATVVRTPPSCYLTLWFDRGAWHHEISSSVIHSRGDVRRTRMPEL